MVNTLQIIFNGYLFIFLRIRLINFISVILTVVLPPLLLFQFENQFGF